MGKRKGALIPRKSKIRNPNSKIVLPAQRILRLLIPLDPVDPVNPVKEFSQNMG